MALEDRINKLRKDALSNGNTHNADAYQGITKDRIAAVLREIDRYTLDQCDVVFALLDDEHDSWFTSAPSGTKLCAGASTAHIACHVGILQRGGRKLDREGRDYWLKPLWELGAVEKVHFDSKSKQFISGHPIAKSSSSAYRLAEDFQSILKAPETKWRGLLRTWIEKDQIRQRLALQAQMVETSRSLVDTKHSDLIRVCCQYYVPRFLPGYEIIYTDDSDGERVSEPDRDNLYRAGIKIELQDAMPDVLLWNPKTEHLWVIEAVTSDGEVDNHKVAQLTELAKRSGKSGIEYYRLSDLE